MIPIAIPPLRERREDIPLLVEHFLRAFRARQRQAHRGRRPAVMDELERYDWPGNVRELENTIERAVVLATGPRLHARDAVADGRDLGAASRACRRCACTPISNGPSARPSAARSSRRAASRRTRPN